jgi:hypothetical protein
MLKSREDYIQTVQNRHIVVHFIKTLTIHRGINGYGSIQSQSRAKWPDVPLPLSKPPQRAPDTVGVNSEMIGERENRERKTGNIRL